MPYINPETKRIILETDEEFEATPGILNFCITECVEAYREEKGDSYTTFNEIIGAIECAKQEFYRRVVVPYEEKKCKDNGDVYVEVQV